MALDSRWQPIDQEYQQSTDSQKKQLGGGINSLTAIGARERQLFDKLLWRLAT